MPKIRNACLATTLLATGFTMEAAAQATPPGTINLLAPPAASARIGSTPSLEALGMKSGTVGAVLQAPLSLEATNSFRNRSNAPQSIQIPLPGGRSVVCALRPEGTGDGRVVMSGEPVNGATASRCDLVVENGRVTGDIDDASGRYRIVPGQVGGTHAVVELRTEGFPDEEHPKEPPGLDRRFPAGTAQDNVPMCDVPLTAGQKPKMFGPIRVLIAYTPAAKAGTQNIDNDITLLMAQLQKVMSPASTGGRFGVTSELAHATEINYSEANSPDMDTDLKRLSNPQDPLFNRLHSLRNTHKADLVHLLIKSRPKDGCGIGWYPGSPADQRMGFTVSDRQCAVDNYSFAHELGHNIGLHHDRFVEKTAKPGPQEFHYDLVLLKEGIRTTMAYNDECAAVKKNCRRILLYSTPLMVWNNPSAGIKNVPLGRPTTEAGAAYNTEILCRNATAISHYR